MRSLYSRAARVRKDIIEIVKRWQRNELSTAEAREAVDTWVEEAFREIEQDVLNAIRREDE